MVNLTFGAILVNFICSYWGNEMIQQYSAIADACYEVDFVGIDRRFQKGLCMIIQRSQKPIKFTVGKFTPLTLNNFVMVSCCNRILDYFICKYNKFRACFTRAFANVLIK